MNRIILAFIFMNIFVLNAQTTTHVVSEKETLYAIAIKYKVTVETLQIANQELLANGLKVGQKLVIPQGTIKSIPIYRSENNYSDNIHLVLPKESLFSIARLHDVSVQDLSEINVNILKNGLQIGTNLIIPNKKKTLDGRTRIINGETVFHVVESKETKYSISKKYGITIEQLEAQNPEIINGLVEGNRLAINISEIKPKNDKEELMIALAEKQVALEKNKVKSAEVIDLQDKLVVQKEMNQKVIKINRLKVNLNDFDNKTISSSEKLKLVLETNKNVQEILISKLDSLIYNMTDDLSKLKKTEIVDLEESKKLEKDSYESIGKTDEMLFQLKKDLADNRKTYSGLMNQVQRITLEEHQVYKNKAKENQRTVNSNKSVGENLIDEIYKIQTNQEKNDKKNQELFTKIDSLGKQKKIEIKRQMTQATFYSAEARSYDDKMALQKLKHHQKQILDNQKDGKIVLDTKVATSDEIKKSMNSVIYDENKKIKIEVLKNLKEVKNGYYIVLEEFKDSESRDKFIIKLMDSGQINSNFVYNVNKLSYYVYSKYFEKIDEALFEYKSKESKLFFEKMFILQINNE